MKDYFAAVAAGNCLHFRGVYGTRGQYTSSHKGAVAGLLEETFSGLSTEALKILAKRRHSVPPARLASA